MALAPKIAKTRTENCKFRQDWRGGTRGVVTIEYIGNEFSFPMILGNKFLFPRASTGNKGEAGVLPHYLTHRASARGGDGHRIIPHIGHQLLEGMGTLSFLQAGRSCGTGLCNLHCPDVVYQYQQLPVCLGTGAPALEWTLLSQVACGGKDTASPHTSDIRL